MIALLAVILHRLVLQSDCMSMMMMTIEKTCTVYAIQLCYVNETMQAQMFEEAKNRAGGERFTTLKYMHGLRYTAMLCHEVICVLRVHAVLVS
jgi:hypothetical protein